MSELELIICGVCMLFALLTTTKTKKPQQDERIFQAVREYDNDVRNNTESR